MKTVQLIAIALVVLGALVLAYGSFNYSQETQEAGPGSVSLPMDDTEQNDLLVWAGAGGVVIGGLLFVLGRSHR